QVRVEDAVPIPVAQTDDQVVLRHAGVVDQHVERPEVLFDALDQGIDRGRAGHVTRVRAVSLALQAGSGLFRALRTACDHGDARTAPSQVLGDRAPDPPAAASDDGYLSSQFATVLHHFPAHDCRKASISSAVPSVTASAPRSIRLRSPLRTDPGPSSKNRLTPASRMVLMQEVQRTGEVSCWIRSRRAVAASSTGSAVTFETTGNAGRSSATSPSRSASPDSATAISGEWNAPDTLSCTARRAPAAFASSTARSTAWTSPLITSWPGEL